MKEAILGMALGFLALPVWSASFDCSKASTFAEESVCSDEQLSKLDEALSHNYKEMLKKFKEAGYDNPEFKKAQKDWIKERNNCTNIECLRGMYVDRVNTICDEAIAPRIVPACVTAEI